MAAFVFRSTGARSRALPLGHSIGSRRGNEKIEPHNLALVDPAMGHKAAIFWRDHS